MQPSLPSSIASERLLISWVSQDVSQKTVLGPNEESTIRPTTGTTCGTKTHVCQTVSVFEF